MQQYEYKVIPAPARAEKTRGAKTTEERYAVTLAGLLNAHAQEGWEFVRSETLPTEERAGFTKRRTVYVNLLVLRRPAGQVVGENAVQAPEVSKSFLSLGRFARRSAAPEVGPAAPRTELSAEGQAPKLGPATPESNDPS